MPDTSSAKPQGASDTHQIAPLPQSVRIAMNLMMLWPALHVAAVIGTAWCVWHCTAGSPKWWALPAALATLYLLPPLLALPARVRTITPGAHDTDTPKGRKFLLRWWWTSVLQSIFLRLPFLEELLRLLPFGCYSLWLRLWGAKIGPLVFWSPSVVILDRGLLEVGSGVIIGSGVRLHPHVLAPHKGRLWLLIGPIKINSGALVGGLSLFLPGVEIAPGAASPPFRHLKPFVAWPSRKVLLELPNHLGSGKEI